MYKVILAKESFLGGEVRLHVIDHYPDRGRLYALHYCVGGAAEFTTWEDAETARIAAEQMLGEKMVVVELNVNYWRNSGRSRYQIKNY